MIAAQNGHTNICKELLKSRAKINARGTKRADTPLHLAAFKGHLETVEYLLKKQADPSIKNVMQRAAADVTQHAGIKAALLAASKDGGAGTSGAAAAEEEEEPEASSTVIGPGKRPAEEVAGEDEEAPASKAAKPDDG